MTVEDVDHEVLTRTLRVQEASKDELMQLPNVVGTAPPSVHRSAPP